LRKSISKYGGAHGPGTFAPEQLRTSWAEGFCIIGRHFRESVLSAVIEYLASCHCGALEARYRTAVPVAAWSVRACQCAFCRAHGALSASDPAGTLAFSARDLGRVHRYRFGTRTAEFLMCRECGVYVGARFETSQGRFGILNTRTLRPIPEGLPEPAPMNYGDEHAERRQERREARWTPLATSTL
jgi:hypothetical protein